jgi:hypothetical protein
MVSGHETVFCCVPVHRQHPFFQLPALHLRRSSGLVAQGVQLLLVSILFVFMSSSSHSDPEQIRNREFEILNLMDLIVVVLLIAGRRILWRPPQRWSLGNGMNNGT